MAKRPESPQVEVYCNACRVSFPVGTRRCVHCGGRVDRHRVWGGTLPVTEPDFLPGAAPGPESPFEQVVLEGDEMPRRSGLSPLTLVWIAVLLAGYLYRACVS